MCSRHTLVSSTAQSSECALERVITERIKCRVFSRKGKIKIVFLKEKGSLGPTEVTERPHDKTVPVHVRSIGDDEINRSTLLNCLL